MPDPLAQRILPLRQRDTITNQWLKERLDTVIPDLMARTGFDVWLVIAREYNEDPVIMTLLPAPQMSARRRTILLFARNDDGTVDRLTLSRYGLPGFYESGWNPDEESQYDCLARLLRERDPASIGLNYSTTFAFGDGLSYSEHQQLAAALGPDLMSRTQSAEQLCVGWLERRIEPELTVYSGIVAIGHALIAEAFSSRVIQPGITTTDDVVWYLRQRMLDLGVAAWFQPTVNIQAHGEPFDAFYAGKERRKVIQPADLLHCDVGFTYLGLATDQQQHAYVLRRGEHEAPAGLHHALTIGNRLQDIHLDHMCVGRTGNEVLAVVLAQAEAEDIQAMIYSHPLGNHGHAAGPTIGLWDRQGGVPGRGDYPIFDDTCYSIELNVAVPVPEWDGQLVRIALEEDAVLTQGKIGWLAGRQEQLHLIGG